MSDLLRNMLAATVSAQPSRFAAFATLPTPDPATAAKELERTVRGLGFVGAMLVLVILFEPLGLTGLALKLLHRARPDLAVTGVAGEE